MKTLGLNKQLLTTCIIYLMSLLLIKSAFAHQVGVIDSHFTVTRTTVKLMYTVPMDQLAVMAQGQNTIPMVDNGFTVLNDNKPCPVRPGSTTKPLENITSQQFFVTYQCDEPLGNITVVDRLAKPEDYKNFTRFSLAGMSKNVVFSATANRHEFPVGKLVAMKNITLTDEQSPQASPDLTWENFSQSSYYLPVGLEHILLGPDHILFLIGLLLLINSVKSLLILITCFTLSHSIALLLSVVNMVNLSTDIIEPLIALSIVYIAIENIIRLRAAKDGETVSHGQHQWLIVTLFGFIHGFGFSFLLKEMGHSHGLLPALTFFNLGVEIGQLLIVVPLFLLLNKLPDIVQNQPQMALAGANSSSSGHINMISVKQVISLITGIIGLYWLIERTLLG